MKKCILIITGFFALTASAQTIALKPYVINPSCYGSQTGSIEMFVYGGVAPYTFSWNKGLPSAPAQTFLSAGVYSVTVTDNVNHTATSTVQVVDPKEITVSVDIKDVSAKGMNDGEVKLEVNGGTPGYSFEWNNQSTDQNLWDITAGNYSVVVTDASGCTASNSANVYQVIKMPTPNINDLQVTSNKQIQSPEGEQAIGKSVATGINEVSEGSETGNEVVAYPNPATNVVNIKGAANESEITLININGQVISQQKSTSSETKINVSDIANGTYVMVVRNGEQNVSRIISIAR